MLFLEGEMCTLRRFDARTLTGDTCSPFFFDREPVTLTSLFAALHPHPNKNFNLTSRARMAPQAQGSQPDCLAFHEQKGGSCHSRTPY